MKGFSKFVAGSWIARVAFNARYGIMTVGMRNGKVYRATGVKASDAAGVADAPSVGRAFNAIKRRYAFQVV